jgi:hypothetical protein
MKEFYVYEYRNPVTKVPFYVGKGSGRRYLQHLTSTHNTDLTEEIEKLKSAGLVPDIEKVFFTSNEEVALNVEEHLVKSYGIRRKGGLLCNYLDKCFSANTLEIPEEVYDILGTMPDRVVGELTGINWSTLRTKRINRGIPSFRQQFKGKAELGEYFKKYVGEQVTLFNTNGDIINDDIYNVAEKLEVSVASIKTLFKGGTKQLKGWYTDRPVGKVHTDTVREVISPSGNIYSLTYPNFAALTNNSISSSSNFFRGLCKSLKGWYLNTSEGLAAREKARKRYIIYKWLNKVTGEVFEGRAIDLERTFGLTSGNVHSALNKGCACNGWYVEKVIDDSRVYCED